MYISKLKIHSYKSIFESKELRFSPGINVIIGPNNSGKTALLEALSLNFLNKSHISEKVWPNRYDSKPNLAASKIDATISLFGTEMLKIYGRLPKPIFMAKPIDTEAAKDAINREFNKEIGIKVSIGSDFAHSDRPDLNLYAPLMRSGQYSYEELLIDNKNSFFLRPDPNLPSNAQSQSLNFKVLDYFRQQIYRFVASRVIDICRIANTDKLKSNAENLADVLLRLSTREPYQYELLNADLTKVFPEIKWVYSEMLDSTKDTASIYISKVERNKSRRDLAFPLSECGTGIGQVLAMLYILHNATEPKVLIIDEPQSFLHPRAVKTLMEILKQHPQHQYFIATHSPIIISSSEPTTIMVLMHNEGETSIKELDSYSLKEIKQLLSELGVESSDVFGADNVLWVEGPTEENCFPLILKEYTQYTLRDIRIFSHDNIGDLAASASAAKEKLAKKIFQLHGLLSKGNMLYTSKVCFIWDRECRNINEIEKLKESSGNLLQFLPRRMYENYLINEKAIAEVINKCWKSDSDFERVSEEMVAEKLKNLLNENDYFTPNLKQDLSNSNWRVEIDGSSLLDDLLKSLTNQCLVYKGNKPRLSLELTEAIIKNRSGELKELAEFIEQALNG